MLLIGNYCMRWTVSYVTTTFLCAKFREVSIADHLVPKVLIQPGVIGKETEVTMLNRAECSKFK
jgi:hypothetical protein